MGIDIYMKWPGQTEAESKAQITGFSVDCGNVGYLREAYHGGPYATRYFVEEAFGDDEVRIPANVLRERLPAAVMLATFREYILYGCGERPEIIACGDGDPAEILAARLASVFDEIETMKSGNNEADMVKRLLPHQIEKMRDVVANQRDNLCGSAKSLVEFTELAERKELETGSPVTVFASY